MQIDEWKLIEYRWRFKVLRNAKYVGKNMMYLKCYVLQTNIQTEKIYKQNML